MLPNFLCVGTQRSGTTTLHHILGQHPDLYLPKQIKEPHFFDNHYQHGVFYYERAFFSDYRGESAVGEITPIYMYDPDVPMRIAETLGNIKIIVSLRNPAERAYSHYRMNYSYLWEAETFSTAVQLEAERLQEPVLAKKFSYLDRGLYAKQVQSLLKHFPRENILFLIAEEDTYADIQATANRVFNFLGISEHPVTPEHANKSQSPKITIINKDSEITIQSPRGVIKEKAPAGSIVIQGGFQIPFSITKAPSEQFRAFIAKHTSHTPPNALPRAQMQALIANHFLDDIHELEQLIGRNLGIWTHVDTAQE